MSAVATSAWHLHGLQALVLDNGVLRVVVLPELGGKIWQIRDLRSGRDLLWHNPRLVPRPVPAGSTYDDVFFGGWDELFPNDVPEELAGEPYPDHGEVWAAPWRWRIDDAEAATARIVLTLAAPISACRIVKTVTLRPGSDQLELDWEVTNDSPEDLPYLWKQHVAVPTNEPANVHLGARTMLMAGFGRPRAGGEGVRYDWPWLRDEQGRTHDMRTTLPRQSAVCEFQYATELEGGWCAVTYADGSGLGLAFDRDVFRSCWTFASYGGWRSHEVLILEPCTGYPVGVAEGVAAGTHQVLAAGRTIRTSLRMVSLTGLAEVTGIEPDGTVHARRIGEPA